MTVLIIDNYDSFTYNLYQQIGGITGDAPAVFRNDAITLEQIKTLNPTHIVLSPGPGHPANPRDFGICADIITNYHEEIPTLGVCLGHQGIIAHLGGEVVSAPSIVHGKVDTVVHDGTGLFHAIDSPLEVMRYHSLIGKRDNLPKDLCITSETNDKLIMSVQHEDRALYGLQFHPESVGTPEGNRIIRNFLTL